MREGQHRRPDSVWRWPATGTRGFRRSPSSMKPVCVSGAHPGAPVLRRRGSRRSLWGVRV